MSAVTQVQPRDYYAGRTRAEVVAELPNHPNHPPCADAEVAQ